jgi:hypothetical protein
MSITAAVNSVCAHVTVNKGDLAAQFYVTRDGLTPPIYLYSGGIGYMLRSKSATIDDLPAELREGIDKAIRKYQAKFLLK